MKLRVYVGILRASNGTTYVVTIEHEDEQELTFWDRRRYTPYEFKERYKAEYEAACLNAFFNKTEGPFIGDYNEENYPNEQV